MPDIVRSTLLELFDLLGYDKKEAEKTIGAILTSIEKEVLGEVHEGLQSNERNETNDLKSARGCMKEEEFLHTIETASSRVLVNFFADNKKDFDERQKEVFLAFLLTNKLKRELEKLSSS